MPSEEELIEKVASGLANLDDNGPDDDQDTPDTAEQETKPAGSTPETQADEKTAGDDEPESTPEDGGEGKKPETETPVAEQVDLPDAYIRAAVHNGWKVEDVVALAKAQPELAKTTFKNIYDSVNNLSNRWAQLGRAASQKTTPDRTTPAEKPVEYAGVDVAALEKEYGKDDKLVQQIAAMDGAMRRMAELVGKTQAAPVTQVTDDSAAREQAVMKSQLDQFFNAPGMEVYKSLYGTSPEGNWNEDISAAQYERRVELARQAQIQIAGAAVAGVQLTFADALNQAHMLLTRDSVEKAALDKVKSAVVKRAKGVALNPATSKGKEKGEGKPKTQAEFEGRTQERLNKVFG